MSRRTSQQDTGDELEQEVLRIVQEHFPDASLTKGSGSVNQDGDVQGLLGVHVECKNSTKPGKGRSISKKDWSSIKTKARRRLLIPAHVGFDDDREAVVLMPFKDFVALIKAEWQNRPDSVC